MTTLYLEGRVDRPKLLDHVEDVVQVVPNVLLHDPDEGAKLLEQEIPAQRGSGSALSLRNRSWIFDSLTLTALPLLLTRKTLSIYLLSEYCYLKLLSEVRITVIMQGITFKNRSCLNSAVKNIHMRARTEQN